VIIIIVAPSKPRKSLARKAKACATDISRACCLNSVACVVKLELLVCTYSHAIAKEEAIASHVCYGGCAHMIWRRPSAAIAQLLVSKPTSSSISLVADALENAVARAASAAVWGCSIPIKAIRPGQRHQREKQDALCENHSVRWLVASEKRDTDVSLRIWTTMLYCNFIGKRVWGKRAT
jgi:hypothetical protein